MRKKLIIVGAGISGLSAGFYARMNGYEAGIYEQHTIPGGLCTAWTRKGYTFDISMHMLTGSVGGPFHQMWRELGVVQSRQFHYHDEIGRIESGDKEITVTTNPDELLNRLKALSPADAALSEQFVKHYAGKTMMGAASLKPAESQKLWDKAKMFFAIIPFLGMFAKYGNETIQEFAGKFKDPFVSNVIRFMVDSPGWPMQKFPMVAMAGFLKGAVTEAGVPIGGSRKVMEHLAQRFEDSGGRLHTGKPVSDLIVKNDKVNGIVLRNGKKLNADTVIWTADGHTLIFDLLKGKYINDEVENMYDNWIPVEPMIHVCLGVNRDMSNEPHRIIQKLEKPFTTPGKSHEWLSILHHSFDPTMAPRGKSAVEVWFAADYNSWEKLAKDKKAYKAEKKRIADFCIKKLNKRWPGFDKQVEVTDVATPVTYVRYTGNWKGSPDGWYITPENMGKQTMLRTLPGLKNLRMAGQWTVPFSGTVMAAVSGRQCIELMCREDKKRFVTEEV